MKFISIFLIVLLFISCSTNHPNIIRIDGATTVLPVIAKAAEIFHKDHPDLKILINAGGSGVGINLLGSKKIDLGMISRNITNE
jgi:phosphate transport system substrate-binding protein